MKIVVILLMLFPAAAQAQTLEALPTQLGNMPPGFYPASPCAKPKKPEFKAAKRDPRPGEVADKLLENDLEEYNRKIAEFNKAVTSYSSCAKIYIENSRYDIEKILSTVNAMVAEVQGAAPPPPPTTIGNLPADFYPPSPCVKPDQRTLGVQPAITDVKAMGAYNLKVEAFNQQAATFNTCVKTYRDRAYHDIQEIQAAVQPPIAPSRGGPYQ